MDKFICWLLPHGSWHCGHPGAVGVSALAQGSGGKISCPGPSAMLVVVLVVVLLLLKVVVVSLWWQ